MVAQSEAWRHRLPARGLRVVTRNGPSPLLRALGDTGSTRFRVVINAVFASSHLLREFQTVSCRYATRKWGLCSDAKPGCGRAHPGEVTMLNT